MPDIARWPYGTVFEFNGIVPTIDPTAFIAPTAAVIGNVVIGAETASGSTAWSVATWASFASAPEPTSRTGR